MARNKSVKTSSSASGTTSKPREERVFFRAFRFIDPETNVPSKRDRERERERRKKVSVEEGKERKKKERIKRSLFRTGAGETVFRREGV